MPDKSVIFRKEIVAVKMDCQLSLVVSPLLPLPPLT